MWMLLASGLLVALASIQQSSGQQSPCSRNTNYGRTEADVTDCARYYSCTARGWRLMVCYQGSRYSPQAGGCVAGKCTPPQVKFTNGDDPVIYYMDETNGRRVARTDSVSARRFDQDPDFVNLLNNLPQDVFTPEEQRVITSDLKPNYYQQQPQQPQQSHTYNVQWSSQPGPNRQPETVIYEETRPVYGSDTRPQRPPPPSYNYQSQPSYSNYQPQSSYSIHQPQPSYNPQSYNIQSQNTFNPQPSNTYNPYPAPSQTYNPNSPPSQSYNPNPVLHQSYITNSPPSQTYNPKPVPHQAYVPNPPPSQSYNPNPVPHQSHNPNSPPSFESQTHVPFHSYRPQHVHTSSRPDSVPELPVTTTRKPHITTPRKHPQPLRPTITLVSPTNVTRVVPGKPPKTTTVAPAQHTTPRPTTAVTTAVTTTTTTTTTPPHTIATQFEDYSLLPTECGKRVDKTNYDRIYGGVSVDVEFFPWQVGLKNSKTRKHFCGGTIISKKFIMSAAHCFIVNNKPQYIIVRVGDTSLVEKEVTEKDHRVERIYAHEMYKAKDNRRNDIALIKLRDALEFNEAVQPACLPRYGLDTSANDNCAISGWGATENSPEGSKVMVAAVVPLISRQECIRAYRPFNITIAQFCAGREGYDTCNGDSGGPLVCRRGKVFSVHGITSFGVGCGLKDKPGVYTMVSMYRLWIEAKMKLSSTNPRFRQEASDYEEEDLTDDAASLKPLKALVDYEDTDINET